MWGFEECSKLETLHLSASKYAELGRVSLQSQRHVNIFNFCNRLSLLDPKRYASKAFSMLINDVDDGHSNWVSHARDLQFRYEIEQSDTRAVIKTKVISHFQSQVLESLKKIN